MKARTPWYTYHEFLRDSTARLVGALPDEVVVMNTLTTNLHLMLASFYRPGGQAGEGRDGGERVSLRSVRGREPPRRPRRRSVAT